MAKRIVAKRIVAARRAGAAPAPAAAPSPAPAAASAAPVPGIYYAAPTAPPAAAPAPASRPVAPARPRAAALFARQASAQLQSRAAVVPAPAWSSSPKRKEPAMDVQGALAKRKAAKKKPAARKKKTPSRRTGPVGPVVTPLLVVAIHDSDGEVSYYRPTPGQQLFLIFNAHAIGKRVPVDSLAFFLDGSPISGDQTPEDLGLESGDRIDCVRG